VVSRAVSCIFATRKLVEKIETIWTGINSETKRSYESYLTPNAWNKDLAARKPDRTKNVD
jgi:hypothetical protein